MGVSVIEGVSSPGLSGGSLSVSGSVGGVVKTFIPHPLLGMPLKEDLRLLFGAGSATFTRSTTGTFIDKDDGLIKTASIDVPRLEANGVLIEGASTNLALQSEDFGTTWGTNRASVSTNVISAPDGNTTADKLVEDSTAAQGHNLVVVMTAAAGTLTLSVYAKAAERSWLRMNFIGSAGEVFFDVVNGIVGTAGSTATITPAANGFFRCSMTSTNALNPTVAINLASADNTAVYDGDGTSGLFIWGAQAESLTFASSYIPTGASTVTRALDDNSIVASNIPAPTDDYTLHTVVDVLDLDSTKNQILFNVDGETTRRLAINTTTGIVEATHGAVTSVSTTAITPGTPMEITFVVDGANQTLYIDKVQEDQDAKGTVTGSATRVSIGNNAGSDQLFGKMKPLEIYSAALTNTQQEQL